MFEGIILEPTIADLGLGPRGASTVPVKALVAGASGAPVAT
jgi:hypothetical protein